MEMKILIDLYKEHYNRMYIVARQILHDEHFAEDCVQEVFLKLMKCKQYIKFEDEKRIQSLMIIMVRNVAINEYRRKKRKNQIFISEEMIFEVPELWIYDKYEIETENELARILLQISPIYRDILTLKYIDEYSNYEIAKLLNITEVTVRKRIERAKKKLKKLWKES